MNMKSSYKVAPHSKESEMMVLGCMLSSINHLNNVADVLEDTDFYFVEHRLIFRILKDAYRQDKPADVHLVCEELKRQDKLESVGGAPYVTTLAQYAGTSAYVEEYAEIVRDKAILRQMIQAAQIVEKKAHEEPPDVHGALDEAQALFFTISQTSNPNAGVVLRDLLHGERTMSQTPFLRELQERQEKFRHLGPQEPKITGIPTHYLDLDTMINGLNNSNLMIIAGRPAMGKTALALNIAEQVCFKNNMPVGIFSLEMSAEQLMHRLVCSQAEVESDKIRTGSLSGVEFQRIVTAVSDMQHHTMVIDDQPGLKITDLRARARRMKESYDIKLLIIDYLQLISGSGTNRSQESRQTEISEISRMLKTLARELNIPILCPSQLSRKVEDRAGHRPMLSDLRESGCLTAESEIIDNRGKAHTIEALAARSSQQHIMVDAVNAKGVIEQHDLVKAFYSGKKVVYRLKTRDGRSIQASGNHPFLIGTNRWGRLDELSLGQKIGGYVNGKASWEEIEEIREIGVRDVYDATVPGVHNFVSNKMIVHNSIEQDSDIVMFLLRREYYDPNDKPGMAELIVAKNRHGSVGSVNLAFIKELVQFRNYTPIQIEMAREESPFASL
ncbi:MAG: replicative DNA helicase [Chlamydiales bacterium]